MNVMSIFQFQSVEIYIMELTRVISSSFNNYMKLSFENDAETDSNIEKAKNVYEIIMNVFLQYEKDQPM